MFLVILSIVTVESKDEINLILCLTSELHDTFPHSSVMKTRSFQLYPHLNRSRYCGVDIEDTIHCEKR